MKRYCLFLLLISPLFMAFQCEDDIGLLDDQLIDADGNVYSTIQIGNQIWMAQNLRTTSFNDGTPIPEYSFGLDWHNGNAPVAYFQWANTDDLNDILDFELSIDYYGAMYNHYAIESGKLAPAGWRIPTAADFLELQRYLSEQGYSGREATALKSAMGWLPSSGNGIDAIGFTGLPNGYVSAVGTPTFAEGICTWATSDTTNGTRTMVQLFDQETILYADNAIQIGAGVRCIKE